MQRFRSNALIVCGIFVASFFCPPAGPANGLPGHARSENLPALRQTQASRLYQGAEPPVPLLYPDARKSDQVDDYHGKKVADPYRWLENSDSQESTTWIEAENKLTTAYLNQIPERVWIKQRLTRLWSYERYGIPFKRIGGFYFYLGNNGHQNQDVLYQQFSLDSEPHVLIDPNTLSADGTVALVGTALSHDGKMIAYGLSTAGSDWIEWKVREVKTGKDLPDQLKWIKFSGVAWTKDDKGLYYCRYKAPTSSQKLEDVNYNQKLYFHRLGTDQATDSLIYERRDHKDWLFGTQVSEDGRFLIIHVTQGTEVNNRVDYLDLFVRNADITPLIDSFDASYQFVGNDGPLFWFLTNRDAPRGKLIAIDTQDPDRRHWKTVVPESADVLENVTMINDTFIASYMKDAHTRVQLFDLDGKSKGEVALPGIGTAVGFRGERRDLETFYAFTSFTTPTTVYRYDLTDGTSTVFKQPKVDFDSAEYETRQVFYPSKDGAKIPMFLSYKKGLRLDGNNPTLLYGYGGFDISLTPSFSPTDILWMEIGGVLAVPNLRGGGEYGEEWHRAGMKLKKQTVFDDFIAAAQWLIANRYTSTPKLAINGASNGGLLVGACLTERPDLFGAAVPEVGVMDMLRFQKFTIGWAWVSDYGSSDNPEEFNALYAYSPLHNIKRHTNYPATLILTADHDDRVVPGHSFKFAATLQAAQSGDAPVLIRIETRAGHGGGKPVSKIIDERSDIFGFLVRALRM
jgi:prolyl oligopeptidase